MVNRKKTVVVGLFFFQNKKVCSVQSKPGDRKKRKRFDNNTDRSR